MQQDDGRGVQVERALDHFPWVEQCVVDGAALLHFVGDQLVLTVEEQNSGLLLRFVSHCRLAIGKHLIPRADDLPVHYLLLRQAQGRSVRNLQGGRRGFADSLNPLL